MFILRWKHTRTGKDMEQVFSTYGQALIRVSIIRVNFRYYAFTLNGEQV